MIKIIIIFFGFCFNSVFPQKYENTLIDSSNQYKLVFLGSDRDINQMREEFACSYPIFVNIQLDTSYRYNYPNPCSPSMFNEAFIFKVPEISEIRIILTDSEDSIYFNGKFEEMKTGYYYFRINVGHLSESFISKNILSEFKSYKILFSIKDINYNFSFSKISKI